MTIIQFYFLVYLYIQREREREQDGYNTLHARRERLSLPSTVEHDKILFLIVFSFFYVMKIPWIYFLDAHSHCVLSLEYDESKNWTEVSSISTEIWYFRPFS